MFGSASGADVLSRADVRDWNVAWIRHGTAKIAGYIGCWPRPCENVRQIRHSHLDTISVPPMSDLTASGRTVAPVVH